MNSAFLRFRLRQFGKFVREVPVVYMIPAAAFEIRSGIRRHGSILLFLYASAWIGLLLPYASLASLWFFTVFFSDMYRYSEPEQILFIEERPARSFLFWKLRLNMKLFLCAIGPVCLVYLLIYPDQWWLAITFLVAITLNVALFVTTKYAYYWPNTKITAGQVPISLAMLSIFLPVLLPVILFFLIRNYLAACRNLNTYLYAYNSECSNNSSTLLSRRRKRRRSGGLYQLIFTIGILSRNANFSSLSA